MERDPMTGIAWLMELLAVTLAMSLLGHLMGVSQLAISIAMLTYGFVHGRYARPPKAGSR